MTQLLMHLWGDYILQSDWMALNKTKAWLPAAIHALLYSLAFLLLRPSLGAWCAIFGTHFLIDRFRLARYVVMVKNTVGRPIHVHMENLETYETSTGYPETCPSWMAVWL